MMTSPRDDGDPGGRRRIYARARGVHCSRRAGAMHRMAHARHALAGPHAGRSIEEEEEEIYLRAHMRNP